ncbi:hypothetical protein PENSPDRAFT_38551 [Peniophora sp. CONT]|nr:hypothetical protein PENSPDRAFT_38551 [Peniophora sp. CONT]
MRCYKGQVCKLHGCVRGAFKHRWLDGHRILSDGRIATLISGYGSRRTLVLVVAHWISCLIPYAHGDDSPHAPQLRRLDMMPEHKEHYWRTTHLCSDV